MKRYLLSLPVIALALVGCDPVSERDCGVFDHPDLARWQADQGEPTITFMNSEGTEMEFLRQSVVLNEPFPGADGSSNDEDVICELTARIRIQSADNSLAFTSIFIQQEQSLLESADEALLFDLLVESPAGTELAGSFLADISDDRVRSNPEPLRVIYLEEDQETEEIGGQAYEDVIRINSVDRNPGNVDLDPETGEELGKSVDFIDQVVIAQKFGIVAFTRTDGLEFVRVPLE